MPTSCCAYNCTERFVPGGKVSFHRFPTKNEMLFRAWCIALRRKDFHPTWSSRICSKHFTKDSFTTGFKFRLLKRDAVPTIFNFGQKRKNKYTRKKLLHNSTKNESYKSHSSDSEDDVYLNDSETSVSSEIYSVKESPTTVEIVKVKRQGPVDRKRKLYQGQSLTLDNSIYGSTEDSMTFGELDSLHSKQLKNIQCENEVLRQTIFQLNKKIEEFKNLTNIIPSDDLFKDLYDDESSGSSKICTSEEKPKSVEIIKIKREESSQCNEYEYHQEQLEESADGTTEDSENFIKIVKTESIFHNQLKNLQIENEVLRKTIQDLKKMIKRIKCLAHSLRSHGLILRKTSKVLKNTIYL
ncbi:hypothetical protein JTE90_014753 [Oedothorax gibbosus]|uniref:THAP-type domain-containing protein n=1 Tax=Oedothorax gibbosus TaxID=931172 RepID=A0AAV6US63_9ARAC|nr:hypothetical protein JTE90_014753 [Oedothorax gibbosus]